MKLYIKWQYILRKIFSKMDNCLNNNKAYDRLETAWKDCGKVSGCDFVMKYHNNKYYLRRTSDPNFQNFPKVRGYIYNQCREWSYFYNNIFRVSLHFEYSQQYSPCFLEHFVPFVFFLFRHKIYSNYITGKRFCWSFTRSSFADSIKYLSN